MKKIYPISIFLFFCLFSNLTFAQGANASGQSRVSASTTADAQIYQGSAFTVTVNLVPGSLKANIERIAKDNGWSRVVWDAPNDYNWAAETKIKDQSLAAVMRTILANYPLQAVFYQGNRVLVIQTRTIR